MSEKKQSQEEAFEDPSSIEIVTVGIKNSNAEIIHKEVNSNPNPLPISAHPSAPQPSEEEAQPEGDVHLERAVSLGDKEDEQKIREHVQEMLHQIEAQQSHHSEQNQQSNVSGQSPESKSQKSQKKDGPKSSYQSNDQRKQDLPTSRKCFNKLCYSKKIFKKIRSRVEQNKYRFFCRSCYDNYYNNLYCQFCEQIYSINCQNEDDDKWIGCDHCQRWNHIECEKKFRDKNVNELKDKNLLYECLACTLKSKSNSEKGKKTDGKEPEEKIVVKAKIEISKDQRTPIFHKKIESFPNLQYFLQNYSFRLWINESQIREDLQHLRNICLRAPQDEGLKSKFKKLKND